MGIFDNVVLEDASYLLETEVRDDKYSAHGRVSGTRRANSGSGSQKVLHNPRYGEKKVTHEERDDEGRIKSQSYYMEPKKGMDKETKRDFKNDLKDKKKENKYATKASHDVKKKYGVDSQEYQSAHDAARRHYRKTMKEAFDFLDSIEYPYNG